MGDLANLLERVEKAEGADKALSREIQCRVGGWYRRTPSEGRTRHPTFIHPDDCRDGKPVYDSLHGTDIWREPPDVTASLDAALALAERKLPGRASELLYEAWSAVGRKHALHMRLWKPSEDGSYTQALILALLAALLRALIAQEAACSANGAHRDRC